MASFDSVKETGLARMETLGEKRKQGYKVTFGESLKCLDKVLRPQVTFIEGTK